MKGLFTICLSALILSSQAIYESGIKQGSLFTPEKFNALQHSPIGRAIINLAELTSHVKGESDFSLLWAAIDELIDGLKESKDNENELFDEDQSLYQVDNQYYSNQVTKYQNEASFLKLDIEYYSEARQFYEQSLIQKSAELGDTQQRESELQKQLTRNQETFDQQNNDYNNAINVIDQANDLLGQVQESASFLQHDKNADKIVTLGSKLKLSLKNLDQTRRVFYQPIIKLFVQMTEKGFADQDLLNKVITYLGDLRQSLINNKQTLVNSFQSELAINEIILGEIMDKLDNLGDVVIPQIQEDIKTKDGEISTKKSLLSDASSSLNDAEESSSSVDERWLQRQNTHRDLIEEYSNDLTVLQESENALLRGGIKRQ